MKAQPVFIVLAPLADLGLLYQRLGYALEIAADALLVNASALSACFFHGSNLRDFFGPPRQPSGVPSMIMLTTDRAVSIANRESRSMFDGWCIYLLCSRSITPKALPCSRLLSRL